MVEKGGIVHMIRISEEGRVGKGRVGWCRVGWVG